MGDRAGIAGPNFSAEQPRWLEMVRDHIAISMNIEPDDFDLDPFAQEGGLHAAYDAYGDQLSPLLDELNVVLADASKGRGEDGRVPTTAPLGARRL